MSFLKAKLEYLVAAIALAVVGVVVPWWAILAQRLVNQNVALKEQLETLVTGTPKDFSAEANRLHFMLTGEFITMSAAMAAAIGALVYIARQRSLAQRRMQRLLQFTSHELKTPIASVRALLQSLSLGSVPEARVAEFLDRGLLEVDRLEHLTETILAWQRSVASAGTVTPLPHDASRLVRQILEHRSRSGVTEMLEVKAVAQAQVLVDADAFRVILENLLDNARKYGGGRAELVTQVKGREWVLCVKDMGQGFPTEEAENLFDPFRRQKNEGVTHGSGLGLYLSRQLVQRMRGRLTAQSEGLGRGSVFTLCLPVSEATHG